ncbi:abortive infection protein [Calothrix sp. NIES-4071]|nr:abortive infection protein [Calothrix sp. NIES-4071]BAZ57432.1 abortive infection protein [Calothrix sp. NIES-4105]
MTLKRIILIVLTVLAILTSGSRLYETLQEPQYQSRLELYQTDIVLQAQEWKPEDDKNNYQGAQNAILGANPTESAAQQYEKARQKAKSAIEKTKDRIEMRQPITQPENQVNSKLIAQNQLESKVLLKSLDEQQKTLTELELRLGVLQAELSKTQLALDTWEQVAQRQLIYPEMSKTARVLSGLWGNQKQLLPDAQELIQSQLNGWFRTRALYQLYTLQERNDALKTLEVSQQQQAEKALLQLSIVGVVPNLAGLIGLIMLIFLLVQRLLKGKESLLAHNSTLSWSTPWNAETILQVFVGGFFFMGQILVPLFFSLLPLPRPAGNIRLQAIYVLITYILLAAGSISVLYFSIKPFSPLDNDWFRFRLGGKWILWGLGGYCVAIPIVLFVSLVNEQIWRGQGGSNPLLQLALEAQDSVALGIFFITAAIAAPLFEEFLFRGFLLPSLTRYMPVWASILVSSFIFAAAHLSLSEILPLTSLGIILGVVYTRSRNLLAPMMLHSLWNSGTLLTLFVLGSSNN